MRIVAVFRRRRLLARLRRRHKGWVGRVEKVGDSTILTLRRDE